MKYCIVVNNKIKEEHDTQLQAELRLTKIKNSTLIKIPEIKIGLKIYNSENSKFMGEIVDQSDVLWFTKKREEDNNEILTPWMKSSFVDKFIKGLFRGEDDGIKDGE